MIQSVQRELLLPHSPERVWQAIADSAALADWMYSNDFQPRVGHRFSFHVPPNPKVRFDGLIVQCEVLICEPPRQLIFSWSAAGLVDSRVSFRLEPDAAGTRLIFEHSGFDDSQPFGKQAFKGAQYGWGGLLEKLVARLSTAPAAPSKEPT